MLCSLPLSPLFSSLLPAAPSAPLVRLHANLPCAHVDFLLAVAGAHFSGRVNAAARALLARAMHDDAARVLCRARQRTAGEQEEEEEEDEGEGEEEWRRGRVDADARMDDRCDAERQSTETLLFTLQIGAAQREWLRGVARVLEEEEEREAHAARRETVGGRRGGCCFAGGEWGEGEEIVLKSVLEGYLRMREEEREEVLRELAADEEAMAAVVMSASLVEKRRRRAKEGWGLLL